ncbi:trypco2 family protein [Streptomyces sp. NPDC002769]|uniref:trypco2 family protein n=1 Tax=Streptomyces sp. NPDC002769 TaxID=3154542 RepID=UPI0033191AF0
MEFEVELRADAKAKAGFKVWAVGAETEAGLSRGRTHRVSFTLTPKLPEGTEVLVDGSDRAGGGVMDEGRLAGVSAQGGPGSGYVVGGRLALTSARVTGLGGTRVKVFHPGGDGEAGGTVVWCGTPGGRDDAALIPLDDDPCWRSERRSRR